MKTTKYIVYSLLAVFLFAGVLNVAFAEENRGSNKSQAQEFAINGKGRVKIVGGIIQDIAVDKMTVKIWDLNVSVYFNISANTASSTKLVRKFKGKSNISEFAVNDKVNVSGSFVSGSPLTINASEIRDKSIHKIDGKKEGTVQSVSLDGFVLKTEKGDEFTVKIAPDTEIKAGKETKVLSDIKVSDTVSVSGVVNTQNNTILAIKIKIKIKVNIEIVKNEKVSKEGIIESINVEEKSFVLRPETGDNFTIRTNSDTIIRAGNTRKQFSDLKIGDRVEVKGTKDAASSGVINATRITIK